MKGERTWFTKKQLRENILGRMDAGLDTSNEEYSNKDLVKDFEELYEGRSMEDTFPDPDISSLLEGEE